MAKSVKSRWGTLTWADLEEWAGSRSVQRGRSYQRGGRVKDLRVADDDALLATVVGTERYATTVALGSGRGARALESSCTCPVGISCKHAVATVAEYLQALADGRDVPDASDDDSRWDALEGDGEAFEFEEDEDYEESWDDEEYAPVVKARKARRTLTPKADPVDWDAKIEAHLRGKTREDLADLVWSLVRRFPEVYREFRERLPLEEGDVDRLAAEARVEIKKATAEPGWSNHWNGEGHRPDYSRVRHRFERLLDLGHADEVVALGREFLRRGLEQVASSNDEGETATDFAEVLGVVFEAAMQSSLTGPERLLLAIDAELGDDIDAIGDATAVVLDAEHEPEDWSAVADTLMARLKARPGQDERGGGRFSRDYARDRLTRRIASALEEAGRADEVAALYESEARITRSYERLVAFLIENGCPDEAERAAREGIEATVDDLPGIAEGLAAKLCEAAKGRKRWDEVAAHVARRFFQHPSAHGYAELMEAAKKARVEEAVRAAALRFLETGAMPYHVVSPRTKPAPASRTKAKAKAPVAPAPEAPGRVKIDAEWPLPVPDYLLPMVTRKQPYDPGPRPHREVLLEMAMAAGRSDEVLRWYDAIRGEGKGAPYYNGALSYADRVAGSVASTHPERSLEIYRTALDSRLPHADYSAYEASVGYLKKLRPIYEALGRAEEWPALVASIREKYRNRPRFMELLDTLEGRTIVQSARSRKK